MRTLSTKTSGRYVSDLSSLKRQELTLLQQYKNDLGDNFVMDVAFSREGPKKVYVQHRMKDFAAEINNLLQQKANFYVCGDAANMAREVNTVLAQIVAEQRGVPESKGEEVVKAMRASNQYQEDVWS